MGDRRGGRCDRGALADDGAADDAAAVAAQAAGAWPPATYAEQPKQHLGKQLHRRAKELGFEVKKIEQALETVIVDGEVLKVKPDGEIVA